MAKQNRRNGNDGKDLKDGKDNLEAEILAVDVQDIPLASMEEGTYHGRHVQVRLREEESVMLWRLRKGLQMRHAQLPQGWHVESNADALRWLLARLGEAEVSEEDAG